MQFINIVSKRRKISKELDIINKQIDTVHNRISILEEEALVLKQKALEKMHQLDIMFDKE